MYLYKYKCQPKQENVINIQRNTDNTLNPAIIVQKPFLHHNTFTHQYWFWPDGWLNRMRAKQTQVPLA